MSDAWWKSAVVYQIYPRSFCDTSGNGVGDLAGIQRHLDHLAWLGVDAIWISPFFRSPMKDYGYDVSDYCDVDPLFGSLDDFDRLLADAHERGMRVLIDWVPNHTSDQHPWFVEARASRDSAKRDWYVWRDGTPDHPPNNWQAAFPRGPAWSWDEKTEQWYLRLFLPEQPDLNWDHPEVATAMHDTLRFWLDRGVDGFRMDVIHCIGKDPVLPDWDEKVAKIPACALNDHPRTHELLRGIREVLDEYPGERVMVGEVFILHSERVADYYGDCDELHLSFNFPPLFAAWEASAWQTQIENAQACFDPKDAWPTWVLGNHDQPRQHTRYGSEARVRCAAVLLLTLRGTPFLYAGEELGLEDAAIPESRKLDPGNRDGCRAPFPWEHGSAHGWASEETWLPWPPEAERRNAASQREDPGAILHLYRRLLAARRDSPALSQGSLELLPSGDDVLAYRRRNAGDTRIVLINFAAEEREVVLKGDWEIVVASDGPEKGTTFGGRLAADSAVVLAPR